MDEIPSYDENGVLKDSLAYQLLVRGINMNELNLDSLRHVDYDCPESVILSRVEAHMRMFGISVEDLKEGTFYSHLEHGTTVDGENVSKEEGLRIIDQINEDNNNRFYHKIPVKEKTREEIALAFEKMPAKFLRRKPDQGKKEEINKQESDDSKLRALIFRQGIVQYLKNKMYGVEEEEEKKIPVVSKSNHLKRNKYADDEEEKKKIPVLNKSIKVMLGDLDLFLLLVSVIL